MFIISIVLFIKLGSFENNIFVFSARQSLHLVEVIVCEGAFANIDHLISNGIFDLLTRYMLEKHCVFSQAIVDK